MNVTYKYYIYIYVFSMHGSIWSKTKSEDTLEENSVQLNVKMGNAEVQWKNIKESVLDTISDLVGKVKKRARKSWIT